MVGINRKGIAQTYGEYCIVAYIFQCKTKTDQISLSFHQAPGTYVCGLLSPGWQQRNIVCKREPLQSEEE